MAVEFETANAGTGGTKFATDSIIEGADTLAVPYTKLMSGADASKELISGDTANGLDVDVTRLSPLVTGTAVIGRVNVEPQTTGGLSVNKLISAATTNAANIKASAGQVYSIYAHNINPNARFLKLYNLAGVPAVGTDVPLITLPIPGNSAGAGFLFDTGGMGIAFSLGIARALTAAVGDADASAVAAEEIVVTILWK